MLGNCKINEIAATKLAGIHLYKWLSLKGVLDLKGIFTPPISWSQPLYY